MKICKVCNVRITYKDEVLFSYGKSGTKSRLYARVCKFAKDKDNCANKDFDGVFLPNDEWQEDPFT